MTTNKLLCRLLGLRGIVRVTRFSYPLGSKQLKVWVKPDKNGCLCPVCERRCPIIRIQPEERHWRDLRVCGFDVHLYYTPREIQCPTHGRHQEIIHWAAPYAQVSYRFEFVLLRYCQATTQKHAADMLNVSPSTLSDILHRTIGRIRNGHRIRRLTIMGLDEISYQRGRRFATVVYDLARGCVVWVGDGKGRETIDRFFQTQLTPAQRARISFASCDMSETYIGAVKQWCPNAQLVLDRFHVVKSLSNAVDEVRKEQWRAIKGSVAADAVKGLRWLLYRHSSNRSTGQTRVLNALKSSNYRIWRAWVLKDEFERLWEYTYPGVAEKFIRGWITSALKSRLEPIRTFVNTLRKHLEDVLSFVKSRLTNAVGEGVNRILRLVKNRASGFSSLEAFADIIFLVKGDINIPDQIPAAFRTW